LLYLVIYLEETFNILSQATPGYWKKDVYENTYLQQIAFVMAIWGNDQGFTEFKWNIYQYQMQLLQLRLTPTPKLTPTPVPELTITITKTETITKMETMVTREVVTQTIVSTIKTIETYAIPLHR